MFTNTDALVSSSARKLPIKVRPDLSAKRQYYLGRSYWVLKEPIGTKFYRLQDEEYAILKLFDGKHSLDDIKKQFEKDFPPQKITLEDLHHFIGQLHQSGLVVAATPNQGPELLKRRYKRFRKELLQKFTNVLAIKFKGFDPDRLLDFMYPFAAWFFHPLTVFLCLILGMSAASLVIVNFDTFRSKLPEFYTFFSPVNLLCLSAVLAGTKVFHEFGHGLTAKHFRGECHEMGVMILVLSPCLYVNVSDSWLLPNKWHRIAIAAAGMYAECMLASVCTFIWWFSEPGLLNYLALNVMFVSSVTTILFNANPLLRYDGYYMLADYLEIPNLRQKATKVLARKCSQWFLGMEQQPDPFLPQRNQVLFALFSVSAFMYRWVVMASILFFIYSLFKYYDVRIIGQIIAAMSLFSLFVMPLIKVGKFFWVPGRIYKVKRGRFYLSLSLFIGLIAFLLFFPLPYWVIAPAVMELRASNSQQVYVPDIKGGCRLKEIRVVPGQYVQRGDVLGILENQPLLYALADAKGKVKELEKKLASLDMMRKYRADAALQMGPVTQSLAAAKELLTNKELDYEYLTLKAPLDGTVVSPPWKPYQAPPDDQLPSWWGAPLEAYNLEATLEPGTQFCSIGDPKYLEAVIVVDQSKTGFLESGQIVELKLHKFPARTFRGEISEIEKQAIESLDVQLSTRAGGEIPTTTQRDGTEQPNSASYRVRMLLDNPDLTVRVGMTGVAKIHVKAKTLAMRAWLIFNETFNFKL
ncbi:MAG: biotin/lipoyl-binding protein [Planctomycetaceae bacterium]|jgi:putative peptide zinc metalloprotease protein|nr:biotin/lipoyl-binding protein [Planctomycetaceae bacterium]